MSALALTDDALDRVIVGALSELDRAVETAVSRAEQAGVYLLMKKSRLAHGEWLPYLDTIGISARTAQNYMRLAANAQHISHLGGSVRASLDAMKGLPPPHPRLAEMFEAYPGLAAQWGADPDVCEVVGEYLDITDRVWAWAANRRTAEAPSGREFWWAFGVEGLMAREFG